MIGPIVLHGPAEAKYSRTFTHNPPLPGVHTEVFEEFWDFKRWSYGRMISNWFPRNRAMVYLRFHAPRHTPRLTYNDYPWGHTWCVQCDTAWPCATLKKTRFDFAPSQFQVAAFQAVSRIGSYRRLGRIMYPHGAYLRLIYRHDNYRHMTRAWRVEPRT